MPLHPGNDFFLIDHLIACIEFLLNAKIVLVIHLCWKIYYS